MHLMQMVEDVFNRPPVNFNPEQQTLKGWAMYCLRDRGFKVVYAQKGDFAIETRMGEKIYFKVTEDEPSPDDSLTWIVRDRATNHIRLIPPQSDAT